MTQSLSIRSLSAAHTPGEEAAEGLIEAVEAHVASAEEHALDDGGIAGADSSRPVADRLHIRKGVATRQRGVSL